MAQHIRGAAKVHALQTKADELLQPLIEVSEDEESSIDSDEESSQYSTSSEDSSVKVKPTPGQILKAAAGEFSRMNTDRKAVVFYTFPPILLTHCPFLRATYPLDIQYQ